MKGSQFALKRWALLLPALLMLHLFLLAKSNGLWFAEALSVELSEPGFSEYFRIGDPSKFPARDMSPLYYVTSRLLGLEFSEQMPDWHVRLPSLAVTVALFLFGFSLFGGSGAPPLVALMGYALFVTNPNLLFNAVYFRHYILSLLLATLLYHQAFVRKNPWTSGGIFSLAVFTSLQSILLLPGVALALGRRGRHLLIASLPGLIYVAVKMLPALQQRYVDRAVPGKNPLDGLTVFLSGLFTTSELPSAWTWWIFFGYLGLIVLFLWSLRGKRIWKTPEFWFFAPSLLAFFVSSALPVREIDGRYLLHLLPALVLVGTKNYLNLALRARRVAFALAATLLLAQMIVALHDARELRSLTSWNEIASVFKGGRFEKVCFNPKSRRYDIIFMLPRNQRSAFESTIDESCVTEERPPRSEIYLQGGSPLSPEERIRLESTYDIKTF